MPHPRKPLSLFRYFNSWPEIIRPVVMMYMRFPLSLQNVEDLLERWIDICHVTIQSPPWDGARIDGGLRKPAGARSKAATIGIGSVIALGAVGAGLLMNRQTRS